MSKTKFDNLPKDCIGILCNHIEKSVTSFANNRIWEYFVYDWEKHNDAFKDSKFIVAANKDEAIRKILKKEIHIIMNSHNHFFDTMPLGSWIDKDKFPGIYDHIIDTPRLFDGLLDVFKECVVNRPYRPSILAKVFRLKKINVNLE